MTTLERIDLIIKKWEEEQKQLEQMVKDNEHGVYADEILAFRCQAQANVLKGCITTLKNLKYITENEQSS